MVLWLAQLFLELEGLGSIQALPIFSLLGYKVAKNENKMKVKWKFKIVHCDLPLIEIKSNLVVSTGAKTSLYVLSLRQLN